MSRKTSVYLTDALEARWRATGLPLAEILRRGLNTPEPEPIEDVMRRVIREELGLTPSANQNHPTRIPQTYRHPKNPPPQKTHHPNPQTAPTHPSTESAPCAPNATNPGDDQPLTCAYQKLSNPHVHTPKPQTRSTAAYRDPSGGYPPRGARHPGPPESPAATGLPPVGTCHHRLCRHRFPPFSRPPEP